MLPIPDPAMTFVEYPLERCRATSSKKVPAPHQTAALETLGKWYASLEPDENGGILVLPTGGGKTFTAVQFLCQGPLSDGYKVLWLAHTHHLLEQAFHSFTAEALGRVREPRSSLRLRVVSGTPGHYPPRDIRPSDDVIVATLQTITGAHRNDLAELRAFIDAAQGKLFVVFDEAHHSPAPSYRRLLLDLRKGGAPVLGLTATPTYTDPSKAGWLDKLFPQGILYQARAGDLIAQGILAKPLFERAPTSVIPELDEVAYEKWLGTYRDVPEHIIDQLARSSERNQKIASTYVQNRERYGKTLIFSDRWYQCEAIVEALTLRGVKADAVYSHVDAQLASAEGRRRRGQAENAYALERFRSNELDVLVNVRMLTEGTDIPDAQTVFLTRQTTSQILLTQMVGRALRGPKFGGTTEAHIVSFVDDWRQPIRWAEYDPLVAGNADDEVRVSSKRPPLQLISIDLIKRLTRQMDSGINVTPGPFPSLMPVGWYRVRFDVCVPGSDEVESRDQLVMVFDDERKGFESLIEALLPAVAPELGEETAELDAHRTKLEALRARHLDGIARADTDILFDIFHVARHVAQGHGAPEFFPFEARGDHDLDRVAADFIARDLGPASVRAALLAEYENRARFWRALFPNFELFRSYYDACQARLLGLAEGGGSVVLPTVGEAPSESEPDEAVKEQVKLRDSRSCLACGATRLLHVDHIMPIYRGGSNQIDNLQTLCRACNLRKGIRSLRFTTRLTRFQVPPSVLEVFADPDDPGNREHWERFLRRTINFTLECAAVSQITIGGRGETYYNWTVDLVRGNSPRLLAPLLPSLLERIQAARRDAGKPEISLTLTSPGEAPITVGGKARKPARQPPAAGRSKARAKTLALELEVGEAHAKCDVVDGKFVVRKGSTARSAEVPSLGDAVRRQRAQLKRAGILKRGADRGLLVFTKAQPFDSASAAAAVVAGASVNGRQKWLVLGTETSLAEWEASKG